MNVGKAIVKALIFLKALYALKQIRLDFIDHIYAVSTLYQLQKVYTSAE